MDDCEELNISDFAKKDESLNYSNKSDINMSISLISKFLDDAKPPATNNQACQYCLCSDKTAMACAESLIRKYGDYSMKDIEDILFDEKKHAVCQFKDYLIYDDTKEYIKRYYPIDQAKHRINAASSKTQHTMPSYAVLKERKCLLHAKKLKSRVRKEKLDDYAENRKKNLIHKDESINYAFENEFYESLQKPINVTNMKFNDMLNYYVEMDSIIGFHSTKCNAFEKYNLNIPVTIQLNLYQSINQKKSNMHSLPSHIRSAYIPTVVIDNISHNKSTHATYYHKKSINSYRPSYSIPNYSHIKSVYSSLFSEMNNRKPTHGKQIKQNKYKKANYSPNSQLCLRLHVNLENFGKRPQLNTSRAKATTLISYRANTNRLSNPNKISSR